MSIHATVNTNASSALNTQKLINSYTGGVQRRLLAADSGTNLSNGDGDGGKLGVATFTVADSPAGTSSPLDEVSDIMLDFTGLALANVKFSDAWAQGVVFTITGAGLSSATTADEFKTLFDGKHNDWECAQIRYAESGSDSKPLGTPAQLGADRINKAALVIQVDVSAAPYKIVAKMPKVNCVVTPAGGENDNPVLISVLLRRRRRGNPSPASL
jgi:hypothetical protein